jgi:hypothetical protein
LAAAGDDDNVLVILIAVVRVLIVLVTVVLVLVVLVIVMGLVKVPGLSPGTEVSHGHAKLITTYLWC